MAFTRDGKRQACQDTPPVNPDGASATGPLVAALLRTGELEMLAECIEQAGARLQIDPTLGSIDAKRDVRARRPTLNLRGVVVMDVDGQGVLLADVDVWHCVSVDGCSWRRERRCAAASLESRKRVVGHDTPRSHDG